MGTSKTRQSSRCVTMISARKRNKACTPSSLDGKLKGSIIGLGTSSEKVYAVHSPRSNSCNFLRQQHLRLLYVFTVHHWMGVEIYLAMHRRRHNWMTVADIRDG